MPTLSNQSPVIVEPPHAASSILDVALASDVGLRRSNNEDACAVHPSGLLYIVADGMGGHERGEVAATTAARAVANLSAVARSPRHTGLQPGLWLSRSALAAARAAVAKIPCGKNRPGCAAVVVGIAPEGDAFSVAWAGDCRAYRFRPSAATLTRLTADQHVGAMQNVLANALMAGEPSGADDAARAPEALLSGDVLLLTSDGLHGYVDDAAIRSAFLRTRSPRETCEALVGLAYAAKAPDNVTVLVIRRR